MNKCDKSECGCSAVPSPCWGRSVPVSEADMVLAAMETGEWELQRLLPQTCFTSEANNRNAWSVKRSAAPYCTKDGLRIWTGATPLEALCNGAAALGVELPGCSETAALPKTVVAILGEQAELRRLSDCCPELNLSNYGPDDVDELNGWAIEVSQCIDRALAAQPAPAATPQADSQPAPDEIINMAREQGLPETEIEGVFRVNADDLCRVAAAILAARAPADSMTAPAGGADWQDISTAPKDGTRFVAVGQNYGLDSEAQHTCIAQWFRGCWMEASDWNETSELKYLTHWMPLPPLPCSAARAPADSVLEDAARLDWLLLHISGAEFRRIGVHYSGNASRAAVDAARKQGANHD